MPKGSRVIHNGCRVMDIFDRADGVRRQRNGGTPFTIGMISRLDSIKDYPNLLKAYALLRLELPDASLRMRIIGDGTMRESLERLSAALGLSNDVEFMGDRADVPEQLG